MINILNSSVNFSTAAFVVGGYRADIIVTRDSKLYTSALTLSSYLSMSWLRFFYLFVCSGTEVANLVKSRNLYLIFAILIALSVNFFILILLQLLLNLNSESDNSFRATYRDNLLIYSWTALFSLNYLFFNK